MIRVIPDSKIVIVRGVYRMDKIEAEVLGVIGKRRWNWREWSIVGLADVDSSEIVTGMPFTPVSDREEIGFRRKVV